MYTRGDGEGYGMLESWIARLGCYTVREEGAEAFSGDAMVVICPSRSVPDEFREKLKQYVADGGKLLVIDSPENAGSTANSVLWPFGMSIHHDRAWKGKLSTAAQLPAVDVAAANEVVGGQPVARLAEWPVAAAAKFGKGSVMAVGFGSLWNDKSMGEHVPKEIGTPHGARAGCHGKGPLRRAVRLLAIGAGEQAVAGAAAIDVEKGPQEMGPQEMGPKETGPAMEPRRRPHRTQGIRPGGLAANIASDDVGSRQPDVVTAIRVPVCRRHCRRPAAALAGIIDGTPILHTIATS